MVGLAIILLAAVMIGVIFLAARADRARKGQTDTASGDGGVLVPGSNGRCSADSGGDDGGGDGGD